MKFSIYINQKRCHEIVPEMGLKEACILDYIKGICLSPSRKLARVEVEGDSYTWVNYGHLLKNMPILQLKGTSSISRFIIKLEEWGLISCWTDHRTNKKYVRLTEKADLLEWSEDLDLDDQPFDKSEEVLSGTPDVDLAGRAVDLAGRGPLFKRDVLSNKYINTNKYKKAETAKKVEKLEKNVKAANNGRKLNLSSIDPTPTKKRKPTVTDPNQLMVLKVYRELYYKGCNSKNASVVNGLNLLQRRFEEHFGKDWHLEACRALRLLNANEEWANKSQVLKVQPKTMFTDKRIDNYLLPLIFKHSSNGTLHTTRPGTESELREIEEANEKRNAKRLENLGIQ